MSEYSILGNCKICNTDIFADEPFSYDEDGNMVCDYCKELL